MPTIQDYMRQYAADAAAAGVTLPTISTIRPTARPPVENNRSDLGLSLKAGVQQLPGIATGLADIPFALAANARPVSNLADWMGRQTGFQPAEWAKATEAQHTPEYKQSQAEINKVWENPQTGALDVAKAYATHPGYVANQVAQSLPSMVAGGAISRGLMLAGRGAIPAAEGMATRATPGILERRAGEWAAPIAGGIGEGAVQAGQQMDQYQGEDQRKNAVAAVGSGVLDALIAGAGGRLANRLGFETPETAMAKGLDKAILSPGETAPSLIRRLVGGALSEGALQEFPQSFQEQVWQNFADNKPLTQGALRQAVEGGLAGGILGAGANLRSTIQRTPPGEVGNDALKGVVDEHLAPPAPTEPLQAEYERAQREFEVANQPQGNRYPELAQTSDAELQRMSALLSSKEGKSIAGAQEIKAAIAEELQARAKAAEPTLAQQNDAAIAQTWGRPEFALEPSPVGDMQAAQVAAPEGIPPATDLSATAPLFDEAGRVSPEVMIAERAGRTRAAPDVSAEEVAARLQAAAAPRAPGGQAAMMAGQLPTPSPIVTAVGGGAPIPAASLKGLPTAAKTELAKHLGNPEQMAAAVADMFYTKASAGSSAGYVFDKLPALYQQLTGQPLPETPPVAAPAIAPSAIGAQGAEFLQGETPAQAAANFARRQEQEALAQPLPVVQQPRGKQQSTFLDRQGEVDLIQPGMSRRESAAQRRAREFAAQNKAARQKLVAETLGTNIPEVSNAIQESKPARLDARQPAPISEEVGQGNAQGYAAAAEGQAAEGEINGAAPNVVEQGGEGAGDNAAAGTRAGRVKQGSARRAVRGRARAPEASNGGAVAVGAAPAEQVASVAPEVEAPTITKGYAFKDLRDAYLESKSGPTGAKARLTELTGIAEIEQIGGTKQQREQAKKFLDSVNVDRKEAAAARRQAQDAVGRVAAQETRQVERDKAAVARQKAVDKQLKGMTGTSLQQLEQRVQNARNKNKAPDRERRNIPPAAAAEWDKMMSDLDALADKTLKGQASGTEATPLNPNVHTLRSLAEELVKTFGEDMRSAIMAGRVKLVTNQTHLAADTGDMSRRGQITRGMYYYNSKAPAGTGTVYFVAGNLAKTQQGYTAFDVALHEIGEHAGMEQMLGKQVYSQLMSSIRKAMAVQTPKSQFEKDVAAAKKKLLGDQQGQPHEVLAYMIQHTPDSTGLQKMWAAIKAFAARFGLLPDSMKDAATMRALAEGATAKWLSGVAGQASARGVAGRASGQTQWKVKGAQAAVETADENVRKSEERLRALKAELVGEMMQRGTAPQVSALADAVVDAAQARVELEQRFLDVDKATLAAKKQELAALVGAFSAGATETKFSIKGAASGIANPEMRQVFTNFGEAAQSAKGVLGKVEALKPVDWKGANLKTFRTMASWITKHHMVKMFDKWFNGALAKNAEADTIQQAMSARTAQLFNEPYNRFKALPQELQAKIAQLMELTEMKLDPRKPWEAHTHLQGLKGNELAQAKQYHSNGRQWWGQLGASAQGKTAQGVYNDLAAMNEALYTMELAVSTYNMVHANAGPAKDLAVFRSSPTEKFLQSGAVHGSIEAAHTYWKDVLDRYTEQLDTYVAEQRGLLPVKEATDPEVLAAERTMLKGVQNEKVRRTIRAQLRTRTATLTDDQKKVVRHLSPLEAQLRMANETTETFKHAPYFHLGRFGDEFVSFRVRADKDGQADPVAMAHVQQQLAKEFPDVAIRSDATDPHVFARFESVDQAAAFEDRARVLQKEGWLMPVGAKDKGNTDLGEIRRGTKQDIIAGYHTAGPNWLSRVVESIQAEGFDDAVTKQMVAHVRSMYLDALPDTAAIKVKQKREGRPGWYKDMIRNYAHRMRVGSNKVASLAAEPTRTQSFAEMNDALVQAETDPKISKLQHNKMSALVSEMQKRDSNQMAVPDTPGVDMLRAINHAYFLGMSPSYLLIQMTQLGVLTWPELAKKYGFVKAAKALGEVTGIAFKVVGTVLREGYARQGLKGVADMVITGDMLEKAGLSKSDAEFLVKIMAAGKLDIGNAARNVGRVAEGETGSEALKIATAMGYASEILTRTVAALAAKRLYKGKEDGLVPYAIGVVDESMMDYSTSNEGRMMGKQGVAGVASTVMFSFMKYQAQLLEKLYREIYSAVGKQQPGESDKAFADRKAEARKFLGGHLMALMALAGSLGLPFATVIAAAADGLCEMFGDGHCDSKVAMRNMTAEIFGHDIEPLLSRGIASRGLGFDVTERAGEGDILPFSKFLADKRAMDERLKTLAVDSWGAPTAMIGNALKANEKFWQGDLLGSMQDAVPSALKGPVRAYQMSEKGYTDKAGNVLPMSAGAYDIFLQAFGLNPGEKADYQQAKFAQSQRAGVLGREATQIRTKLASAIEQNDTAAMQNWLEKARAYDAENMGSRAILPEMGSVLQQRARARAMATAQGSPLGVSPKDIAAQRFTSFYRAE